MKRKFKMIKHIDAGCMRALWPVISYRTFYNGDIVFELWFWKWAIAFEWRKE